MTTVARAQYLALVLVRCSRCGKPLLKANVGAILSVICNDRGCRALTELTVDDSV